MRRIVVAAKPTEHSRFLPGSIAGFLDFAGTTGIFVYFFVEVAFMTKA